MSARLADVLQGYLDLRWHLDPVEATVAGRHDLDGVFADFDRESVRADLAALRSYTSSLEEVDADSLDDEIDRTAALHAARHDILVLERERPFARNPAFHLSHALRGLELLLVAEGLAPDQRAAALLERLRALPGFLARAANVLTEPKMVFVDAAQEALPGALALLRERLDDAAELFPSVAEEFEAARAGAVDAVLEFGDALTLLSERAEEDFAVGRELFDRKLHTAHMIQDGADEVMRYGERLHSETLAALERAAAEIQPEASWREVALRLGAHEVARRRAGEDPRDDEPSARPIRRVLGTPATREGWTLYRRTEEDDVLVAPEERVLRLYELLWRTYGLTLDVALHTRRLERTTAMKRLRDELGISPVRAEAEVRELCARPTVGLCPAVGRREILRLRADAQRARGPVFDLSEFHREMRDYGALPTALARWGMGLA